MRKKLTSTNSVIWTFFVRLLVSSSSATNAQGASMWDQYLPSSLSNIWKLVDMGIKSDSPLTDIVLEFMDQFREGLKEARANDLPLPDFDWIIEGKKLNGVIQTHNLVLSGLADFKVKNLTTSVLNRMGDIEMEFPLLDLHGDYELHGNCFSMIPVWARGHVSIKVRVVDASLGAQLIGSLSSPSSAVHVSHPKMTVQGIHVTLDGFMVNLELWHLILIGLSSLLFIVLICVGLILFCIEKDFKNKLSKRYSSYRAVI